MKILGVDSSGMVASVAIVENDTTLAEYSVNYKKTHSETLLPMIDEIVSMTDTDLASIDAIAVAAGPGSFTGLRIGSATVKGLGLALDKPVISVPSLQAMAYNMWGFDGVVCSIMDARRSQVYTGVYDSTSFDSKLEQCAIAVTELIEYLNNSYYENGTKVCFVGDGIPVYKDVIDEKLKCEHVYAPAHMNRQRAAAVATLGALYAERGEIETAAEHKPIYLRKPQAEREAEAKAAMNNMSN